MKEIICILLIVAVSCALGSFVTKGFLNGSFNGILGAVKGTGSEIVEKIGEGVKLPEYNQVKNDSSTKDPGILNKEVVKAVVIKHAPDLHVVKRGETLIKIANRYKTNIPDILKHNKNIKNPNKISPGQKIIIPPRD